MRDLLAILMVAAAIALGPAHGYGQIAEPSHEKLSIEVTALVGHLSGGSLSVESGELRISSGGTWGVLLDIPMYGIDGAQIELSYARLQSDLSFRGEAEGNANLYGVTAQYWHVGVLQEFVSDDPLRPFALLALGATGLTPDPSSVSSEWKFSGIVAGGAKFMVACHIGLRLEGRLYTTYLSSTASFLCGGEYGCFVMVTSEVVFQGQVNAGLIVAF